MFVFQKKDKDQEITLPEHLTKEERKQVKEIIRKAKKNDGVPRTAQQSIPFERMFQNGICRVGSDYYTKTIQFQDINYQLALQEDKTEIFEEWCSFLNFFDSSIHFEFSFMNMATDAESFSRSIAIPHKRDDFVRLDSLGAGYSEPELRSIFEDVQNEKQRPKPKKEFDLLINIQEKLAQGKGRGYENWAKVFNVKQIAQTLLFLEQNGIRDYSVLEERAKSSSARFEELSATIKSSEKRLAEIAVLKTHIINYSKTRDVYVAYRKSGYSKKFFEAHREEITLHKAAKEAFNALPESQKKDGKIPTVKQLSEEYARVLDKKKKAYSEYREAREEMKKYTMAKHNIDEFLRKSEQE